MHSNDPALPSLAQRIVTELLHRLRTDEWFVAPEYVSPSQAAVITGVPTKTFELWRWRGDGPRFFRLGTGPRARIRYRIDDLRDWIEKNPG